MRVKWEFFKILMNLAKNCKHREKYSKYALAKLSQNPNYFWRRKVWKILEKEKILKKKSEKYELDKEKLWDYGNRFVEEMEKDLKEKDEILTYFEVIDNKLKIKFEKLLK